MPNKYEKYLNSLTPRQKEELKSWHLSGDPTNRPGQTAAMKKLISMGFFGNNGLTPEAQEFVRDYLLVNGKHYSKINEMSFKSSDAKWAKQVILDTIISIAKQKNANPIDILMLIRDAINNVDIMNVLRKKVPVLESLNHDDVQEIRDIIRTEIAILMLDLFKKRNMWI